MAKYSYGFKKQVVEAYPSGEGSYEYLAKRCGIPASSNIKKWVQNYETHGDKGLMVNAQYCLNENKNKRNPCISKDSSTLSTMRRKGLEPSQEKLPLEPESSASAIPPSPLAENILSQNTLLGKPFFAFL